jgi:hypothetical protein
MICRAGECRKASKIFGSFAADQDVRLSQAWTGAEGRTSDWQVMIPKDVLLSARGFAIFTVVKMG